MNEPANTAAREASGSAPGGESADAGTTPSNGELFAPHPLRQMVLGEMHARPFQLVQTPRVFLHYGFATDDAAAQVDREWFKGFCQAQGVGGPSRGERHFTVAFAGGLLRWERHAEFTTYTWDGAPAAGSGVFGPLPANTPFGTKFRAPGPLLVAARLDLIAGKAGEPIDFAGLFDMTSLAASQVDAGAAVAATDFRQDGDGRTRILVVDTGDAPQGIGSVCQRLLEVETYRTLALLGLPEAQRLAPQISATESSLATIASEILESTGLDANQALLHELSQMAAEVEAGSAASGYRFGASRAYDEIVTLRLAALGDVALPGCNSWRGFLARRLRPAMRTCETTEERQNALSRKLARAATLLRTRVDVELERQNRDLLEAMNRRARLQLRLQQTVEGLSVAAISYYVVGLIGYVAKGGKELGLPYDAGILTAAAVPLVLLVIWWLVRRIRRHHDEADE
ncbi:DUF3422 domain-containing protein [Breoghania sp. L-A4]|uniref:DUF3422 family protein n=1 Tax=Breoghania sp. L-A4 TaxID=2304600 RepID=UPI000E35A0C2|nr:DUF3422 domain-containing protein [Breoghania sp. L-A4]AXS42435.1 DUF3422 domain-containing protein [Breoghania sp. L-A4]